MNTVTFRGADRMFAFEESQTLAMARRVRELKAAGKSIFSLTLGEPDFDTPQHIKQAAVIALEKGYTKYPPVPGIPELRTSVANWLSNLTGANYIDQEVVISTGAKQSLVNAVMSLVNPGDEVIIPTPCWVSYIDMVKMAGGKIIMVETSVENDYKLTPEQLSAAITPQTRLLMTSSPSNPTGCVYSQNELQGLAEVLLRYPNCFVISDEIYSLISYDTTAASIAGIKGMKEKTITISGVSKAFAMTGWRIGFMAAPVWIAKLCEKYQGQITSGANIIAQYAALEAITADLTPTYRMVSEFKKRRDAGIQQIKNNLPNWVINKPEGAFYFYPEISAIFGKQTPNGKVIANPDDFTEFLLEEAGVAVVSGTAFGTNSHIRLSYACSVEMLSEAIQKIAQAQSRLH
ncbi:MAG: pyridoxal phosphate-dependent aminotransferase [Bacteroidia bacterium]|nr:pyridoxal phosphate-dependent aminotransferase [Bacteroidia bacterium]